MFAHRLETCTPLLQWPPAIVIPIIPSRGGAPLHITCVSPKALEERARCAALLLESGAGSLRADEPGLLAGLKPLAGHSPSLSFLSLSLFSLFSLLSLLPLFLISPKTLPPARNKSRSDPPGIFFIGKSALLNTQIKGPVGVIFDFEQSPLDGFDELEAEAWCVSWKHLNQT